jgi:hypothetical protein
MKLYALVLTTVLFALPACAETIRLVDAKVDAVRWFRNTAIRKYFFC